jgi:RNA 3'-terminal phosphate cyclase
LQTVLPALLLAEGESNLILEGGTHNEDKFRQAKIHVDLKA